MILKPSELGIFALRLAQGLVETAREIVFFSTLDFGCGLVALLFVTKCEWRGENVLIWAV